MKKCRTYLILCLLSVLSLSLVNSINDLYKNRSTNNNSNLTTNTNHHTNEEFYIISVQDDIYIESDTDYEILKNNKYKIKANSLITIFYKDSASTISAHDKINIDSTYHDYIGFYVNDIFYDKEYFANNDIKIVNNTSIKPASKNYNFIGIGIFQNTTKSDLASENLINLLSFDNNSISSNSIFLNLISLKNNLDITSRFAYDYSISENCLSIDFESYEETKSICTFAIYQNSTEQKIVILEETNLDKNKDIEKSLNYTITFNNISEIEICFYKNLTYKNR